MADKREKKESKVEVAKRSSRHLRGTIAEVLASDATHFAHDDVNLLKFHGTYQQDDRDVRHERRKAKDEEAYQFMVRCSIPAGVLTAEQYLNMDRIAGEYADGSLRVTTRQDFQLHGVIKRNLKATIAAINEKLMTTLSACGDVERNVMACPAPLPDEAHETIRRIAREIGTQLRPASRAYHEIWLNGEKQISSQHLDAGRGADMSATPGNEEPFYGDVYLPRKFKTAISLVDDNCVDIYTHDMGLIAFVEDGKITGYNLLVGGGMGMTHGKEDTMAKLGDPLGFIAPEHAVEATKTVAAIFRDFGNRADRRHARLKYVIAERGIDWFREEFSRRVSFKLEAWKPIPKPVWHDHLGRNRQDKDTWFYGVYVENGRIKDNGVKQIKTALRKIVAQFQPGVTLTPHQNVILTGLSEHAVDEIEKILADHDITPAPELSAARRFSMACPALPTCGLAMAESERIMPSIVDRFEQELESLGLRDEAITLRMTGCPNGCARPYTADIALVGRRPEIYHVYVGGGLPGDRAVDLYAADVHVSDMLETLRPLLSAWAAGRRPDEGLSDFYHRTLGNGIVRTAVTGKESPTREAFEAKVAS